jgi:hypothetical protein
MHNQYAVWVFVLLCNIVTKLHSIKWHNRQMMSWKVFERKQFWLNWDTFLAFAWCDGGRPWKTCRVSQWPSQDSNRTPSTHLSTVLLHKAIPCQYFDAYTHLPRSACEALCQKVAEYWPRAEQCHSYVVHCLLYAQGIEVALDQHTENRG